MITINAKINLIQNNRNELDYLSTNLSRNNISSELGAILGVKKETTNPFILGASKLGNGSTFSGGVDYFIGNVLCDESGNFAETYSIEIYDNNNLVDNLNSITIAFDTTNNRHPKSIIVNGVEYFDDDAIYTIIGIDSPKAIIEISNWNTPNYPIVISGIYLNIDIDINERNLISFDRGNPTRSDNKLPSYGIISSTGNIEFNDLNGEIKDYAEQLLLTSDLVVKIYLNNTLTRKSVQIGDFETEKWDYDNDNRVVNVTLKDDLEEWQDIQISGINYDPREPFKIIAEGRMSNVYKWLWDRTPSKYKMLSYAELDEETKTILYDTKIAYPLLKDDTLWKQWEKLCQTCALYIYKDVGKTICSYYYGV